jgi:undecaprenyl-diphosphatase
MLTLSSADQRVLVALLERRRPAVDTLMRLVTKLGNWYVILPVSIALALGVVPELESTGVLALWTLVGSHLGVQALKRGFRRERPQLPVGFERLVVPEDRFAFPSGHATAGLSVGLSLFMGLTGPLAGLALLLGLSVGISRCYLGVHYPGDVLTGWALAVTAVLSAGLFGLGA